MDHIYPVQISPIQRIQYKSAPPRLCESNGAPFPFLSCFSKAHPLSCHLHSQNNHDKDADDEEATRMNAPGLQGNKFNT